jgi:hypothetical protein
MEDNMKVQTFKNTGGESVACDKSVGNGSSSPNEGATGQGWAGYGKHKSVQKDSYAKGIDRPKK